MDKLKLINEMAVDNGAKIVMLVMDGLGGLPLEPGGPTELEAAKTPNMDALTARASLGMSEVVAPAFSPGSGPGHMALFGYDPLEVLIGRGVLEAMGIGFPLTHNDVAIRANFCTVDANGNVTDRRAGRIPTEECEKRVKVLRQIQVPGVQIFVEPVKEYRFVIVLRGEGLGANIPDNDSQLTGVPALPIKAEDAGFGEDRRDPAPVVGRGQQAAGSLPARQQLPAARHLQGPRHAALPRGLQDALGGGGGLPDVQRCGPPGGHGRDRARRRNAGGRIRSGQETLGRVRFLLHPHQEDRQLRRGRQLSTRACT